jgi:hypothetical protein
LQSKECVVGPDGCSVSGSARSIQEVLVMHSIAIAALLSFAAATASAAGVVNVTFVDPDKYFDAGKDQHNEPNDLAVIEQYLKDLGQRYLPDGQVLNISVLGVDMAGYTRPPPARRGGSYEIRIARFAADWPRITLRYSLESNGQPISQRKPQKHRDLIRCVSGG